MESTARIRAKRVIALVNASDDTLEMVQRMLDASGFDCAIGCRLADLKRGRVSFAAYLRTHNPDVVIFDISPPYAENWHFFIKLNELEAMKGRGCVLTTTNKDRLDEAVGRDTEAFEFVGKPYDLEQIKAAIDAELIRTGRDVRHAMTGGRP